MIGQKPVVVLTRQPCGKSKSVLFGEEEIYLNVDDLKRTKVDNALKELHKRVGLMQDRQRKLKTLSKSRVEHADLEEKIEKWRVASIEVSKVLKDKLGEHFDVRKVLRNLGIESLEGIFEDEEVESGSENESEDGSGGEDTEEEGESEIEEETEEETERESEEDSHSNYY